MHALRDRVVSSSRATGLRLTRGRRPPIERVDAAPSDGVDDAEIVVLRVPADEPLPVLSPAERAVAALIVDGKSNAQIAKQRGTSIRTVNNQVASILRKLHIESRAQLALVLP